MEANGHDFVPVAEGWVFFGASDTDAWASEIERPRRERLIQKFAISRHATSAQQFREFAVAHPELCGEQWRHVPEVANFKPTWPATNVSWESASAYCLWLSEKTGRTMRLPTEAEWERAARGDDVRIWPWGDEFDPQRSASSESGLKGGLAPVTDFEGGASPFGVVQMSGGVWEWCADFHHDDGHAYRSTISPVDLRPGPRHVVKGGSIFCTREVTRISCRDWTNSVNQGGSDDGFRVVLEAD